MAMNVTEKPVTKPVWGFRLALIGIFLMSLGLRFWGLSRFNTLVFDEVYYAKFANNYLTQTPFFDGHPPLSKYLIAIGIWIGNRLPWGQNTVNMLAGSTLSTFSYRWLNALTGSFIPLVVSAIAFQLNRRRSFALIAGLFAAMDGLFLVESRYALNNVYLVLFGLLGLWFLLLALESHSRRMLWLPLSGVFFVAAFSIKWNGLWFMFGALLLWVLALGLRFLGSKRYQESEVRSETDSVPLSPLYRLSRLNLFALIVCFAVIPAIFYYVIWIPHIQLNPEFNFVEVQRQILSYHRRVGSGANVHPYCSTWYSWILMLRPVAYFYQVANSPSDPLPTGNSALVLTPDRIVYDVHAMGNPPLWWLSSAAIVLTAWSLAKNWRTVLSLASPQPMLQRLPAREVWTGTFLFVNYVANLLPWIPVSRCVFLYHYMGCSVFATLMLAWLVDRWLKQENARIGALWIILLIGAAFVFWMPIYLGLPLTEQGYQWRMWFRSWI
jgi:dolichyl-phosphate-mannose-protein mannosyltransferase